MKRDFYLCELKKKQAVRGTQSMTNESNCIRNAWHNLTEGSEGLKIKKKLTLTLECFGLKL